MTFVIMDKTCNSSRSYIDENGENTTEEYAERFTSKEDADSKLNSLDPECLDWGVVVESCI